MKSQKIILLLCFICTILASFVGNSALAQLKDDSSIVQVLLPLTEQGQQDLRYERNTIVLNDAKADYFKNLFMGKSYSLKDSLLIPQTYIGINIKNNDSRAKIYLLKIYLYDIKNERKLEGLYVPSQEGVPSIDSDLAIKNLVKVNGFENEQILLPLYFDENKLLTGKYILKTELFLDKILISQKDQIINIEKNNNLAVFVIFISVVLAIITFVRFFLKIKSTFELMKIKDFIIIAMIAVISFVLSSVPGNLLWGVSHIFLGPFGNLVTGIFTSVFSAALTVILFLLVPKRGVYTLYAIARFFLMALILGRISLVSILTIAIGCIFMEYLLSYNKVLDDLKKEKAYYFAFAFAIMEAIITWVDMQIMMGLYRLYYANWYILQNVLICSGIYSFMGAKLGLKIGRLLKKLQSD